MYTSYIYNKLHHISHWGPLPLLIYPIGDPCLYSYIPLGTLAFTHISHWGPLPLLIYPIGDPCLYSYIPLRTIAFTHIAFTALVTAMNMSGKPI